MHEPIPEIDPAAALERQHAGALLLDVREPDERATGFPAGSVALPQRTTCCAQICVG